MHTVRMRVSAALVAVVLMVGLVGCSGSQQGGQGGSTTSPPNQAPSGTAQPLPGEALAREKCTQCHTYDRIERAKKNRAGWESTVARMEKNGLQATDAEKKQIIDYLATRDQ